MAGKEGKSPMEKIQDAGGTPLNSQSSASRGRSLTVDALIEKYGPTEGRRVYYEVALAGGFGDFRSSLSGAMPPLDLTGLDDSHNAERKAAVEAVLADADTPVGRLAAQSDAQGVKE